MRVGDIYTTYRIPLNLRCHMLTVAAVGKVVAEAMPLGLVDVGLIVTTLLLHDMGNILKFNFDKDELLEAADKDRISELRKTQQLFRERFGSDTDEATLKILKEIGVRPTVIQLCAGSHGDELHAFLQSDEWEKKICYYADMRVAPQGVTSLDKRFEDLIRRYPQETNKQRQLWMMATELQEQLQEKATIALSAIDNAFITPALQELVDSEIEVVGK